MYRELWESVIRVSKLYIWIRYLIGNPFLYWNRAFLRTLYHIRIWLPLVAIKFLSSHRSNNLFWKVILYFLKGKNSVKSTLESTFIFSFWKLSKTLLWLSCFYSKMQYNHYILFQVAIKQIKLFHPLLSLKKPHFMGFLSM